MVNQTYKTLGEPLQEELSNKDHVAESIRNFLFSGLFHSNMQEITRTVKLISLSKQIEICITYR